MPLDLYILAILLGVLAIAAMTLLLYTHTNFFRRESVKPKYTYATISKGNMIQQNFNRPKSGFIEGSSTFGNFGGGS